MRETCVSLSRLDALEKRPRVKIKSFYIYFKYNQQKFLIYRLRVLNTKQFLIFNQELKT